jgi:hypothetical protein
MYNQVRCRKGSVSFVETVHNKSPTFPQAGENHERCGEVKIGEEKDNEVCNF